VLATGGVALGQNASVTQANSVALGTGSAADGGAQGDYIDVVLGEATSSAGEVPIGSPGAERQITNVAAGSASTDAANIDQVQSAESQAVNLSENYTNYTASSLLSVLNSYGYNTSGPTNLHACRCVYPLSLIAHLTANPRASDVRSFFPTSP
jgi:autotransporter adhesin